MHRSKGWVQYLKDGGYTLKMNHTQRSSDTCTSIVIVSHQKLAYIVKLTRKQQFWKIILKKVSIANGCLST